MTLISTAIAFFCQAIKCIAGSRCCGHIEVTKCITGRYSRGELFFLQKQIIVHLYQCYWSWCCSKSFLLINTVATTIPITRLLFLFLLSLLPLLPYHFLFSSSRKSVWKVSDVVAVQSSIRLNILECDQNISLLPRNAKSTNSI